MSTRVIIPVVGLLLVIGTLLAVWLGGERPAPIPNPPVPANLNETEPSVVELIRQFESEILADKSNPEPWVRLGMVYKANTNNILAEQCFEQSVLLDDNCARCWFHVATTREAMKHYEEAIEAMRRVTYLAEGYPAAHWRLGFLLVEQDAVVGAEASFTRATRMAPQDPAGWFGLAIVRMRQGRDQEAAEILEGVLVWTPINRHYGNQLLGTVYRRLGRIAEAERVLKSSQGREISWADQWSAEVTAYHRGAGWKIEIPMQLLSRGRIAESIEMLKDFLLAEPDDPILLSNLAIAYREDGQLDRSIELLQEAVEIREHYHQAHFNLGLAHLLKADLEADSDRKAALERQARYHADFALEVNPAYAQGHGLLGQIHQRDGDLEAAHEEYGIAARDFETGVYWLGLDAELLTRQQRWPEVCDILAQMLDRFTPRPETMHDLAVTQLKAGRYDEAVATVDRFGQLWPNDPRTFELTRALQTGRQSGPAGPAPGGGGAP